MDFEVQDGHIRGSIVLTVCKLTGGATDNAANPAGRKPKIFVDWRGRFTKTSPEEVVWTGRFHITGGTGVYQDLTGHGRIDGYLFCFAPVGCAELGEFRDGQYTMRGRYRDPTATL